jgi:hypothetical protein
MKNLVGALAMFVTAAQLSAQDVSAPHAVAIRPLKAADTLELKSLLRDLVVAEEAFWGDHGSYTSDLRALGFFARRSKGYGAIVIFAGGRSWSGQTYQPDNLPAAGCAVFVGETADFASPPATPRDATRLEDQGDPRCDTTRD